MKNRSNKGKKKVVIIALVGIVCLLSALASVWYAVVFNESRLVVPTDFSEYVFTVKDLPMICSTSLGCVYVLFLFGLLISRIIAEKKREEKAVTARRIDPRWGFLGLLGFLGFAGFWTYSMDKTIAPFVFFIFFGFWGFFYEGKMSGVLMDERYKENKIKANMTASRISLSTIFLALILLGQGKLMGNLDYTLIAFVIIVTLSIALEMFLREYLLYKYDHDEQTDISTEEGE